MTPEERDQKLVEMLAKPVSTPAPRIRKSEATTKFEVSGATATVELKGTKEEVSETGALQCLARHDEDPSQWVPTGFRAWTLYDGTEATHYTFARAGSRAAQLAQQAEAPAVPLDDLLPTVRKARPKKVRAEGDHGALILIGDTQFGKGLKSDTPIFTTEGWVKHGDLRVGMKVYGADGLPKRVLDVLPTTHRDLYEVELGDGSVITCDDQHLWSGSRSMHTSDKKGWAPRHAVVSLPELKAITEQAASTNRPFILDPSEPMEMAERALPIDPYLFGLWLGDGNSHTGIISLGVEDADLIRDYGHEVPSNARNGSMFSVRIPGLTADLRSLGVLGGKRIPEAYVLGSVDQRLALVQGLMDADGHAATSGACEFTNTNRQIIDSILFVLRSLGMRPRATEHVGRLGGEEKRTYWRVQFRATLPVFRLDRKAERLRDSTERKGIRRAVRSVRFVGQGDAQCITVEGGLYLAGEELVVTHNCDGDGVEGTLARTIACIDNARDSLAWYSKRYDVGHVHVGWLGDHIEGFVSQGGANAWRTPLTLNEQIRLTRRVMLHALETFSQEAEKVTMAAVPGNHGDPQRFQGKGVTRYDDSHDTEALIAVSEAAAMNPKAFGHVDFFVPETDELVVVQDIAGTRLGQVHGHFWRPGKHFQWWKGQAFNQASLMHGVDVLAAGHLHHEYVDTDGPRTFIQTPAMESESTWWRHRTGAGGAPGLMLAITKDGQVPVKEVVRA